MEGLGSMEDLHVKKHLTKAPQTQLKNDKKQLSIEKK